eukprot:CAMPEP_0115027882 /NCGR_PEP_ID=MMETSP0216-20121206/35873_1 /TAXON_ID=223996 /ORGANISM="Protocruzia adherens, Strain Boccale" /LENGTH=591 /DNA_ID=CAMNT_0002403767 /DNA_START=491 /DNA_END=2266 /DNA_ORIENTATION=-
MYCQGGDSVAPKSGYWRKSSSSEFFVECPNPDACLGGVVNSKKFSHTGHCESGYEGHACTTCSSSKVRGVDYICFDCPWAGWIALQLLTIMLAGISIVYILVKTTLACATGTKSLHSVYIKIMMNHFQVIGILSTLNLAWPDGAKTFLRIHYFTNAAATQVLSLDCLFSYMFPNARLITVKLITMSLMPVILGCIAAIFLILISCKTRKFKIFRKYMIPSVLVIFFLIHPMQVRFLLSVFDCTGLDDSGRTYLREDYDLRCWSVFFVAVPGLVVWSFGLPLFTFVMLSRHRDCLDDMRVKSKYGFLYNGYELRTWYWELVISGRKVLLAAISVLTYGFSNAIQALLVLATLLLAFQLQYKYEPFVEDVADQIEFRSLVASLVVIYCGLYFIADGHISNEAKWFLVSLMILGTLYFFISWMFAMKEAILLLIKRRSPALYKKLCLCSPSAKAQFEESLKSQEEETEKGSEGAICESESVRLKQEADSGKTADCDNEAWSAIVNEKSVSDKTTSPERGGRVHDTSRKQYPDASLEVELATARESSIELEIDDEEDGQEIVPARKDIVKTLTGLPISRSKTPVKGSFSERASQS